MSYNRMVQMCTEDTLDETIRIIERSSKIKSSYKNLLLARLSARFGVKVPLQATRLEDEVSFTLDQVKMFLAYKPQGKSEILTKAWATIGILTGQRFSDWPSILKLVRDRTIMQVVITQKKTKRSVPIVVDDALLRACLTLHMHNKSHIDLSQFDKSMKSLCKNMGFTNKVSLTEDTGGGVYKQMQYPMWQKVTSHTCRRSFATIMLDSGQPVASIMRQMGIERVETFWKYVRSTEELPAMMSLK